MGSSTDAMLETLSRRELIVGASATAFAGATRTNAGVFAPSDPQCKWVVAENGEPGAVLLRKEFTTRGGIKQASLSTSAVGVYETYLNAHRIEHAAWRMPSGRFPVIPCRLVDVTDLVVEGRNGIGGFVASSHGGGGGPSRYAAQLELSYEDGGREFITTDGTWMMSDSPVTWRGADSGETWDARRQQPGWAKADFAPADPTRWSPVRLAPWPRRHLEPVVAPDLNGIATVRLSNISPGTNGGYVLDFGKPIWGWIRLQVQGLEGDTYKLRYRGRATSSKDPDAVVGCDTYIVRGGPDLEVYEPHFTSHEFRFVEVIGFDEIPDPENVLAISLPDQTKRLLK